MTIVSVYMFVTIGSMMFAGLGKDGIGLGNPEIQDNVFFALARPVLGPFAILMSMAVLISSAASLQSTFVSPARTLLSMGYYGAMPEKLGQISPRFLTPVVPQSSRRSPPRRSTRCCASCPRPSCGTRSRPWGP